MISGHVTAGASTSVGFEIEGVTSGVVKIATDSDCSIGCSIYIEKTFAAQCDTIHGATTVTGPGNSVSVVNYCDHVMNSMLAENDPPLSPMGDFYAPYVSGISGPRETGDFTVASNSDKKLWVVDDGEEFAEAVGGIFAAGAIFIVGLIILLVGSILCCVACCCMCTNSS